MKTRLLCLLLPLLALSAAAPPLSAQSTSGSRVPSLIASNECDASGTCVRQMLQLRRFDVAQQRGILHLLGILPQASASAGASTSCTTHEGGGHVIIVCLDIRAEGTCSCVLTMAGGGCIGSNPACPGSIP